MWYQLLSKYSLEFSPHRPTWIPVTFLALYCSLPVHEQPLSVSVQHIKHNNTYISGYMAWLAYFKLVLLVFVIRCEFLTTACQSDKQRTGNKWRAYHIEVLSLTCMHAHSLSLSHLICFSDTSRCSSCTLYSFAVTTLKVATVYKKWKEGKRITRVHAPIAKSVRNYA